MQQTTALRPSEMGRRKRRHRRRFETTALGAAILILAIVGFCTILGVAGNSAYKYVKTYIGPPETKSFFETYLSPVVMQDPKPFSDIRKVNVKFLIKTAIWAALNDDSNNYKYAYTDDNREILPIADIDRQFVNLFGKDIKPAYQTFTEGSATYEYNQKEKCYYIPMIAFDNIYSPKIRDNIIRKQNTVTLTVDYIPGSGWAQNPNGTTSAPPARKTMIYVLRGGHGSYRILSVQNGVASSSSSGAPSGVSSGLQSSSGSASGGSSSPSISSSSMPGSSSLSSVPNSPSSK